MGEVRARSCPGAASKRRHDTNLQAPCPARLYACWKGGAAPSMTDPIRVFIFGLGYSATALARSLRGHAAAIAGTVRQREREAALAADSLAPVVFTGEAPSIAVTRALEGTTHLLCSIPPGEAGDPALRHHRADIVAAPALTWIGYLSTVGVYGRYGGAWVSERTSPHPAPGRATN